MCAFIFGSTYVYSWIVPAVASLIGAIFFLVLNHMHAMVIHEIVFFDIFYVLAYAFLAAYFYATEYTNRYSFYLLHQQFVFQRSYMKLLKNIPIGIILFDKSDAPVFYNRFIGGILAKKTGQSSPSLLSIHSSEQRAISKVQVMNTISDFHKKGTGVTLKDTVEQWKHGALEDVNNLYVYKNGQEEFTYTVKGWKSVFRTEKCRVLLVEDQTAFEKLAKLDEKYQKLYVDSITHDIRTPLNGIVGMLEMLDSRQWNGDEAIYLNAAKVTCKNMLYLTYNITDYSLLETNKFKSHNTKVNIRKALKEVMELFTFNFEKKSLKSACECSDKVPAFLKIDKNRYMQILITLLGNAVKFTFKGSISVYVDYSEYNDMLVASVKDTGIGIKRDELPKLFKLFGKVENPSDRYPQGIGFGLTICKKLSESLGGYINVVSQEGVGSTLTFGIKGNIRELEEESKKIGHTSESQEGGKSFLSENGDPSPHLTYGEIPNKITEHSFTNKPIGTIAKLLSPEEHLTGLPKRQQLIFDAREESKGGITTKPTERETMCDCKDILIVDDNDYNLFVLQGYLKSMNTSADVVSLLIFFRYRYYIHRL